MTLESLLDVLSFDTIVRIINMKNDNEIYRGKVQNYREGQRSHAPKVEVWNMAIVNGVLVIDVE